MGGGGRGVPLFWICYSVSVAFHLMSVCLSEYVCVCVSLSILFVCIRVRVHVCVCVCLSLSLCV